MQYFNDELMSNFYKNMCYYWLKQNINSNYADYIDTSNPAYRDIQIDGVTFDFAYQEGRNVYAYFNTALGNGLGTNIWRKIETATTETTPFYKNEYYICTVNHVLDGFWQLSKTYDNVHIVSPKMLFTTYKKAYNKIAHPRFVPSFVGRS